MSCSAAPLICIPHFFYNADLLHKQAGTLSGKTGSGPRHAEILTRAASCDNVYRGKFGTIQFRDVPDMEHGREPLSCHFDGEGFDLAGPHRLDAVADRREGEPSDSIEQAAQRGHYAIPMLCPGASLCSISAGRASCLISSSPICRMGMLSLWASSISRAMPELTLPPQSHSSSAAVQFPVLLAQRHPTSVGRAGGRRWAYAPDGWHTGTPFSQTRCLPQYLLHRERRCKSVFLCSFRRPHCLYHGAGGVDR